LLHQGSLLLSALHLLHLLPLHLVVVVLRLLLRALLLFGDTTLLLLRAVGRRLGSLP